MMSTGVCLSAVSLPSATADLGLSSFVRSASAASTSLAIAATAVAAGVAAAPGRSGGMPAPSGVLRPRAGNAVAASTGPTGRDQVSSVALSPGTAAPAGRTTARLVA